MTLNQLRALVAVVDHGSMQRAAKALGISRATVDVHIQALETLLGLQLLTRTPGGASLTAPGASLIPRARQLLDDATGLVTAFRADAVCAPKLVHLQLSIALPQVAHVRAIVPERLAELEVTRRVVETTKELSRLYNAGELVWVQES